MQTAPHAHAPTHDRHQTALNADCDTSKSIGLQNMPAMAPRLSAGEVGKAAAQRAKQASHEICDTPTAGQSGIVASRAGMFRSWGLLKSTSQKDLRHSRSDGVRAALQMSAETPRSLTPGRVPTTLQAYIEERPPTPRREEIVTVAMPMDTASYPPLSPRLRGDFPATERSVSRRSRTLLSREESELTLRSNSVTKPRPWSDLDTKPSMARRADGAAFRVRPLTPREGYDMLAAGLPSPVHRAEEDCCRTPREPNMTPSSSVSTACPEPRRRWSDLLADAELGCCARLRPFLAQRVMATPDDKLRLLEYCRKGKIEEGRTMLQEFAKVGTVGPGREYGLDYCKKPYYRSALWEATWKNHEVLVKALAEKGATIDFADYQGRTPLHEAAYYGYQNLVEFFLDKGHPIDPLDNFGQGAQTNLLDSDGVTVQHCANFHGMPDMSEWLLYHGAWKNRFYIKEEVKLDPAALPPLYARGGGIQSRACAAGGDWE
ncbi:Ankyrin repeat domain-containing protein 50 [Symbiodinium microadriaticum]|uniref:Ankyrin repeat domain-containing protein 50 n=1 Tax=Symbiodinium microadriaticum TaxID=2951 RepID=A0A1Q9C9Q4_SYMMI|nr:Ankyrin repeat domain-containing protein 50 [Symbiodinium microadriaticum]